MANSDSMKTLLRSHIEHDVRRVDQCVQAFVRQLADFMQIEVLDRQGQFTFFRRLLNYDDWRVAGKPQSTQFLDYQVVNSNIEAERDHLRVGDHIVRVLTMKEAVTETRPLALDALLKIPANFRVITEWTPLAADKARKEVNKRRRHFNMSKTGFVSQMGNDATKTNPRDVMVDESKQADIENLGDCLRALGDGQLRRLPARYSGSGCHPIPFSRTAKACLEPHQFRARLGLGSVDELAQGKDAAKLTRKLASRRGDKPNPLYYALRTVDVASARLWLIEGIPIDDVATMIEVRRRFEIPIVLCRARAREIAQTAQRMIARRKVA
jgi:hypothetical protein